MIIYQMYLKIIKLLPVLQTNYAFFNHKTCMVLALFLFINQKLQCSSIIKTEIIFDFLKQNRVMQQKIKDAQHSNFSTQPKCKLFNKSQKTDKFLVGQNSCRKNSKSGLFVLLLAILTLSFLLCPANCQSMAQLFATNSTGATKFIVRNGILGLSDKHYMSNQYAQQSLQWKIPKNLRISALWIDSPPIDSTLILNFLYAVTEVWVYSQRQNYNLTQTSNMKDLTLKFQFINFNGTTETLHYNFSCNVNFKGWRRLTRNYLYDMGKKSSQSVKTIARIKITATNNNLNSNINLNGAPPSYFSLFFGDWNFVIPRRNRYASLQMPDVTGYMSSAQYINANSNIRVFQQIPTLTPIQTEQILAIKIRVLADLFPSTSVSQSALTEATNFYNSLQIITYNSNSVNPAGQLMIKGNPINPVSVKNYVETFVLDYAYNNNSLSYDRARNLIWLMYDQGYAYGSQLVYGWYDTKGYFRGLCAMFALWKNDDQLRDRLFKSIQWTLKMGEIWNEDLETSWNSDYVYNCLTTAFYSIVLLAVPNQSYLRQLSIHLSLNTSPYSSSTLTSLNWLQPDHTTFHHNAHYIAYFYSFTTYLKILQKLSGTSYQITAQAYGWFRDAVYAFLVMTDDQLTYANSLCGRHPGDNILPVNQAFLWGVSLVGAEIIESNNTVNGIFFDIKIANAIISKYSTSSNPIQGFYQYNFSPIGVYRHKRWLATIHGMNNGFWGTQIYKDQNRFGRYQSYGTIQLMNNKPRNLSDLSQIQKGFNWNFPPGATTKVLSWNDLNPPVDRADEKPLSDFASALSFSPNLTNPAPYGMYSTNFQQGNITPSHNPTFKFQKSVFCFDGILICLGSGIQIERPPSDIDPIVTTLFQQGYNASASNVRINGSQITLFPYRIQLMQGQHTITDSNDNTFKVNIKLNQKVIIQSKAHIVPNQANSMNITRNLTISYFQHGTGAGQREYQYTIIPSSQTEQLIKWQVGNSQGQQYQLLQQDKNAHIIQHRDTHIVSYSIFNSTLSLPYSPHSPLKSVDTPCMIMVSQSDDGDNLNISLVNPSSALTQNKTITLHIWGQWVINLLGSSKDRLTSDKMQAAGIVRTTGLEIGANGAYTIVEIDTIQGISYYVNFILDQTIS